MIYDLKDSTNPRATKHPFALGAKLNGDTG